MSHRQVISVLLVVVTMGCQTQVDPGLERPKSFLEVSREVGLDVEMTITPRGSYQMPEIMGSGAALFDGDNDGDLDIYLVASGRFPGGSPLSNNRYFRQDNGRFADVTVEVGLGDPGFGMGCAVGDYDNDGDLDVYVSNVGPDRLYQNEKGRFVDVTSESGIKSDGYSSSVGFFDYDHDGDLDIYVTRYVAFDPEQACTSLGGRPEFCGPAAFPAVHDQLFRNEGHGQFRDVSLESGIGQKAGRGLGVVFGDFNGDHRTDIFVANDGEVNQLWINQGDGRFEDRALEMGVAVNLAGRKEASMGIAVGDVDQDGDLDLFLTHLDQETNTLYMNHDNKGFIDQVASTGLGMASLPYTGFGTGFFDYDHDGDLDVAIGNGKVRRTSEFKSLSEDERPSTVALPFTERDYAEPNQLFENLGSGRFKLVDEPVIAEKSEITRGVLFGDIDSDGDLDLLLTNNGGTVRLYRNDRDGGHWLKIRVLVGPRDALGAVVRVDYGNHSQLRTVTHTYGYLTSMDATVHCGLDAAELVDRVVVRWVDGSVEGFGPFETDQAVIVVRGAGQSVDWD